MDATSVSTVTSVQSDSPLLTETWMVDEPTPDATPAITSTITITATGDSPWLPAEQPSVEVTILPAQ